MQESNHVEDGGVHDPWSINN